MWAWCSWCRLECGFLLIGGPVGNGSLPYELYHWTGKDDVEDHGHESQVTRLGTIPTPNDAKAEPLAVVLSGETCTVLTTHWDVLIVFDGVESGRPHAVSREETGRAVNVRSSTIECSAQCRV